MFKGLLVCYSVVIFTFFSVAISGYWAFGNQAEGSVLSNFMVNGMPLLPKCFLLMTYVVTLVQVSAVTLVRLLHSKAVYATSVVLRVRDMSETL
ncbi:UNVERIFIED_CONTAM: GABA transporter 1 [Sesamum latifolium]|uniref:GABA transporter 1 n=1 Tax=Sesamum latifolium TaxID=2727402 RepID=A0AAW2TAE1_9LAMI